MNKILVGMASLGTALVAAQPALAQSTGPAVAVPGSANSAAVVNNNREQNAGYNRVVGAMDPVVEQTPVKKGKARPAQPGEITVGSLLRDSDGKLIGKVDSVDSEGAVVASGDARVKVPLIAFGKDDVGLLLGITAARFHELATKAHASAQ